MSDFALGESRKPGYYRFIGGQKWSFREFIDMFSMKV